jgi:hypothetical protein
VIEIVLVRNEQKDEFYQLPKRGRRRMLEGTWAKRRQRLKKQREG